MPLSYTANPRDAKAIRELPKRLSQGVTFVISRTKTSMPLGFLHLYVNGDVIQYDMLAVHPRHRGKQWGKMLMARGEAYGLSKSCTIARLFVDDGNDKAKRMYEKLGYVTVRYYPDVRCYEMMKILPTASS
ncbi:GNAT family N-acetyltransferase [Paenibacillus spongiae]|uniref:GNAT family N-acetyltransferase n=1 Tax=Paenibacillus spongiae TaxID=2909671 RepID=A0ABY5SFF6_9BACL|nr:GNAT family N-acetyltransferase [Paenibacillus spongiae]UVI31482.1 GNAT family N-acetyltransferase [Paenibacillus spongiae]